MYAGTGYGRSVGSPPPMRGKGRPYARADVSNRITPAHAGKRREMLRAFDKLEDHPRPCGEK